MAERGNAGRAGMLRRAYAYARMHAVRRQIAIYSIIAGAGISLIAYGMVRTSDIILQGISFILVGFVGLIMSSTTMDIGQSLKEAIREEGAETRAVIAD